MNLHESRTFSRVALTIALFVATAAWMRAQATFSAGNITASFSYEDVEFFSDTQPINPPANVDFTVYHDPLLVRSIFADASETEWIEELEGNQVSIYFYSEPGAFTLLPGSYTLAFSGLFGDFDTFQVTKGVTIVDGYDDNPAAFQNFDVAFDVLAGTLTVSILDEIEIPWGSSVGILGNFTTASPSPIPEPAHVALLFAACAAGLVVWQRRRKA